jgi:hypothetical protein
MNRDIDVKFQHSLCTNFKCVAYSNEQITFLKYKFESYTSFYTCIIWKEQLTNQKTI